MALSPGTRFGSYEIIAPLGAGGMGEVYKARDTRLDRDVAIKILPEAFASDADRVARFQREAKTLAALNHPNIAQIFGLEHSGDVHALAMELVAGEDLSQRIASGPIPIDEALPIAKQIAEGLEAAHDQGIIHRDLKPANIKVSPDGTVKVLDFGLAKVTEPVGAMPAGLSMSPTITTPAMTQAGMILGTAAYMSPEQAKGRPADKRSDVWAFGCVLYEMLTRTRAFGGEDVSETLARVLMKDPDWSALPAATPESVRRLLRRCLEKDRRRRVPDIAVARLEFDEVNANPVREANAPSSKTRWARVLATAVAFLATATVGLVWWRSTPPTAMPVTRFSIVIPENQRVAGPEQHMFALAPDGRRLVYVADHRLYARRLDELDAAPIHGGDGSPAVPFFSPNGQWIAFWQAGFLRKLPIDGGTPTTLCAAEIPLGAQWTADDQIIYAEGAAGIMRVSASGGVAESLVKAAPGESFTHPYLLPGNENIIFTLGRAGSGGPAAFTQTAIQSLRTGVRSPLLDGTDARYLADGYLLFGRRPSNEPIATVFLRKFDPRRPLSTSEAVSVLEGVRSTGSGGGAGQQLSVSTDGSLAYLPAVADARTLVWLDRGGREEPLPIEPKIYFAAKLSPDGTRIALDVAGRIRDIWIWDIARATATRLTFGPRNSLSPVWSADGKDVFYACDTEGAAALCRRPADGSGAAAQLTPSTPHPAQIPLSVTPDGRTLLFREAQNRGDLMALDLGGDHASRVVLKTDFDEGAARISPDGKWMAYRSDESGQDEIYVRPFPHVEDGKWQVSSGGGRDPAWARDGGELFYGSARGITSVGVTTSPTFRVEGQKTEITRDNFFAQLPTISIASGAFDVEKSGQRLLVIKQVTRGVSQFVFVEHWLDDIKRRLGN